MSEHDLINTFGGDLHDKQVVDVSGYFNGVPVVVTANDNNIDAHRSRLGHVNLQDSALTFYAMTPNGPKRGTYAEIVEALGGDDKVNIKGDSIVGTPIGSVSIDNTLVLFSHIEHLNPIIDNINSTPSEVTNISSSLLEDSDYINIPDIFSSNDYIYKITKENKELISLICSMIVPLVESNKEFKSPTV